MVDMNSVLIGTNLIAALFIIVIVIGLYEVPKEALRATRYFRYCMWMVLAGLIVECCICAMDGKPALSFPLTFLNYAEYVLIDLITIVYSYYVNYLIEEDQRAFTKKQAYVITAVLGFDICFLTVGTITGKLFTISEGYFIEGPWYSLAGTLCSMCFFAMCILYVFKYRSFRIRSRLFVVLIVAVPMAATVIRFMDSNERFGFLGAAISMNVVYVIIESKLIAEAVANAKMYNEMSENDMLTGLKNRRGYQLVIDGCSDEEWVGVAFVDVNSLKAVNDNQGHEAGDKLIIKVADILKKSLPEGSVCRISGDEFVCIFRSRQKDDFDEKMKILEAVLKEDEWIASFGYAAGAGKDIYDVIRSAEQMMYTDKERYYKETGKDRRR